MVIYNFPIHCSIFIIFFVINSQVHLNFFVIPAGCCEEKFYISLCMLCLANNLVVNNHTSNAYIEGTYKFYLKVKA